RSPSPLPRFRTFLSLSTLLILPLFFLHLRRPLSSTVFPYTTLFRSQIFRPRGRCEPGTSVAGSRGAPESGRRLGGQGPRSRRGRSEEHTSELQSLAYLVCRLLLEKKKHIHDEAAYHKLPGLYSHGTR